MKAEKAEAGQGNAYGKKLNDIKNKDAKEKKINNKIAKLEAKIADGEAALAAGQETLEKPEKIQNKEKNGKLKGEKLEARKPAEGFKEKLEKLEHH